MAITRSGHFIGAYGREAGAVIDFEWVPDPLVFSDLILHVKDELSDRTDPLILSSVALAADIRENFDGEHDPEGTEWAPWSSGFDSEGKRKLGEFDPVTDRWSLAPRGYAENLPRGHSGKILNRWGGIKEAATNPASFLSVSGRTVNDDSLFFDTGFLPAYWVYHQQPESPNTGKIPQRRFLGMSGEAEIQILEIFDQWFQGILRVATSKTGQIFGRRRDPTTGRFMKNPND